MFQKHRSGPPVLWFTDFRTHRRSKYQDALIIHVRQLLGCKVRWSYLSYTHIQSNFRDGHKFFLSKHWIHLYEDTEVKPIEVIKWLWNLCIWKPFRMWGGFMETSEYLIIRWWIKCSPICVPGKFQWVFSRQVMRGFFFMFLPLKLCYQVLIDMFWFLEFEFWILNLDWEPGIISNVACS